jgi:UDPglucose 6-dehydrogenase
LLNYPFLGADIEEVAKVVGTDKRVGPYFLKASVGFGGSCFGKDLLGLIYLCESFHLTEAAEYWRQVLKMNEHQKLRFAKLIVRRMFDNVKGKAICIYGLAFKKDTNDTRDSAAIDVCKFLTGEGAKLYIYDPRVSPLVVNSLFPEAVVVDSAYKAAFDCHAIVVLTEWEEFKTLDYSKIYNTMARPAFFFDGRNIVDQAKLKEIGFKTFAIGKSE